MSSAAAVVRIFILLAGSMLLLPWWLARRRPVSASTTETEMVALPKLARSMQAAISPARSAHAVEHKAIDRKLAAQRRLIEL